MKRKNIFLALIVFLTFFLFESAEGQQSWKMLLDSTYTYKWDQNKQQWILSVKDLYNYDSENRLTELYQFNNSGELLRIEMRSYTDSSMIRILKNLVNGLFVNRLKYLTVYNEMQKEDYAETYVWANDDWRKADKIFYIYNDDRLVQLIRQYLYEGIFQDVEKTDYIYEDYHLIENRITNIITDSPIRRTLFTYNTLGQRFEGLQQSWIAGDWSITGKGTYSYNPCGQLQEIVFFSYSNEEFVNSTRNQYYYSPHFLKSNEKKIAVCHKGHTIYISINALKAHLAHSDCIGECTEEKAPDKRYCDENNRHGNPPFKIYPNPANEKITIEFDKDESIELKRVELTDFYGKLLKTYQMKNNSEFVIYRGNLPVGKYYIRFVGKEIVSQVVIFK